VYAQLEDTIGEQLERTRLTGLTIALIRRDEVVWAKGYGLADLASGATMEPDTVCGIMSVTKPIVGTAVTQLRDAGMFALDDPVNPYLTPVSIKNQWEAESPVTIRQLLTHTAGMPVNIGLDPPGRHELAEYVDLAAKTSWRPGSAMVYANWGYAALGLLIERCSGRSVGEYFRDEILAPLGMDKTIYGQPEGPHANGHFVSLVDRTVHALPMDEWPVIPTSPAGGCWSTAMDLAEFLQAHIGDGTGILAPDSVREMQEVSARQGAAPDGMGLGFRVTRSNGRELVCHGGDGGGFTAFAGFHPEDGVGVALLINTAGMQVARSVIANTALEVLLDSTSRKGVAVQGIRPGLYRTNFWDVVAEVEDDPPAIDVSEGLVVLDEVCESRLVALEGGGVEGEGGMFHGFEVTLTGGDEPGISGGVYPFAFTRVGDIPEVEPIDENADLSGAWSGTVQTPMAPLAITLTIGEANTATVTTPFGTTDVLNLGAHSGKMVGEFPLSFPGVGDFTNFLRLEARGGRLTGMTHARSQFGENAMRTELARV